MLPTARGALQPAEPERSQQSKTDGKIASFAPRGISGRLLASLPAAILKKKALPCAVPTAVPVSRQPFPARRVPHGCPRTMPLADHAPAALRGVATTASWFVIIVCLSVADKNRRPNAFAVLVWLAALSALAASMVGCFSFFASQKLERCRHFMAASAAFSGFWLFVALLTPTKQRDLGKDGLALAAIAVVAAVVSAALALAATRLEEHGALITDGCCPAARPTLPACPPCPPWCVCPDVRAWWGSTTVVTTPPDKAVDDAPRLLYPIPGAAEARVVPVDPAADELPPPPLTVYPLSP